MPALREHLPEKAHGLVGETHFDIAGDDGVPGDQVQVPERNLIEHLAGGGRLGAAGVHGDEGMHGVVVAEEAALEDEGMSGLGEREEGGEMGAGEENEGEGVRVGGESGVGGTEEEEETAEGSEGRMPGGGGGGESADEEVEGEGR